MSSPDAPDLAYDPDYDLSRAAQLGEWLIAERLHFNNEWHEGDYSALKANFDHTAASLRTTLAALRAAETKLAAIGEYANQQAEVKPWATASYSTDEAEGRNSVAEHVLAILNGKGEPT